MTVLLLGVVYWFWSQNQYIQRKINLLENIVYELKLEEPFFHPVESNDDLQPGGVGSGLKDVDAADITTTSHVSSLDSMTVKELRRLAEQRGIENAVDLRKKELIAKLRALAAPPTQSVLDAFNAHEEQSEELQAISLDE
jgi:hypothetical protein